MADVTGGTPPTGLSDFDVPADIAEVYAHFGDPTMFAVANTAALPSSGNWQGRLLMTQDLKILYQWSGSWVPISSPWITYAPTTTIAIGTGGPAASTTRYKWVAGRVLVDVCWVLGNAGGAITGNATFTLPFARAAFAVPFRKMGESATYYDASVTQDITISVASDGASTTVMAFYVGLPTLTGNVTATVPVAIGVGDALYTTFMYDPA